MTIRYVDGLYWIIVKLYENDSFTIVNPNRKEGLRIAEHIMALHWTKK
jgi:hypothetical protein